MGGFIDLCRENDLYFIARPGPFIMAEIKNEGIPHWVYERHPEIVPVGWDGRPATTPTVDYLAPNFLREVRKWYQVIMGVLAPRLYTRSGNIIGVQLDNEIGMLSWVSNCPDLTDNVLDDFSLWLKERYDALSLMSRYPFDMDDVDLRNRAFRSPQEDYALELLKDLGYYMRDRFARYVSTLRSYAEEFGVRDVPFFINIHGTGHGRGFTFPVGISQLYKTYTQAPGYISGSDIYFGDLDMNNFQDLYLINSFMDAMHHEDQPLTSLEFNCGDGNFGNTYSGRYDPSSVDLKARMCIAQGHRMLNYYLFAGGYNYRLDIKLNDGNARIGITGERHGFAAPISPEGELNYTYPRMARSINTFMAVASKLANMEEEHDSVSFAFIPDYYMTEYHYPGSQKMKDMIRNIEGRRTFGAWEIMARAMLLCGYRFASIDIQNRKVDTKKTAVLAVPSARYMDSDIQAKLVDYMRSGGGILLYGEVPSLDMEGESCTILADAMGIEPKKVHYASPSYYLSVYSEGWAAPRPEVRVDYAQTFNMERGEAILRIYGTDEVCGFQTDVGMGSAIVIGTTYCTDMDLFRMALERLGAKVALTHDCVYHGIFMTTTTNKQGERFLHMINLDGFDKEFHVYENGSKLLDGRKVTLQARDGIMMPLNISLSNGVTIVYSTAEIQRVDTDKITFRLTQPQDMIVLNTDRRIMPSHDYNVQYNGKKAYITSFKHCKVDDNLTISLIPI